MSVWGKTKAAGGATASSSPSKPISLLDIQSEQLCHSLMSSDTVNPSSSSLSSSSSASALENEEREEGYTGVTASPSSVPPRSSSSSSASASASAAGAAAAAADMDADYAFALQLQHEEEARVEASLRSREPTIIGGGPRRPHRRSPHRRHDFDGVSNDEDDEEIMNSKLYKARNFHAGNKHDKELTDRLNALKLEEALEDSDLAVGQMAGLSVPSRVLNDIRRFYKSHTQKGISSHGRAAAEDHKTHGGFVDQRTELLLLKMFNAGDLAAIGGVIKTGKEASVHACQGTDGRGVAVKIFRTAGVNEFRNRGQYVSVDARYKKRKFKMSNPRQALEVWAEKEFRNLSRLQAGGVPSPRPELFRQHVLCMEMVGASTNEPLRPAPQLREVEKRLVAAPARAREVAAQILALLRSMWVLAGLVHGDFSEFNVLYRIKSHKTTKKEKNKNKKKKMSAKGNAINSTCDPEEEGGVDHQGDRQDKADRVDEEEKEGGRGTNPRSSLARIKVGEVKEKVKQEEEEKEKEEEEEKEKEEDEEDEEEEVPSVLQREHSSSRYGDCVVIDVGQAVGRSSSAAHQLLRRDVDTALKFIKKILPSSSFVSSSSSSSSSSFKRRRDCERSGANDGGNELGPLRSHDVLQWILTGNVKRRKEDEDENDLEEEEEEGGGYEVPSGEEVWQRQAELIAKAAVSKTKRGGADEATAGADRGRESEDDAKDKEDEEDEESSRGESRNASIEEESPERVLPSRRERAKAKNAGQWHERRHHYTAHDKGGKGRGKDTYESIFTSALEVFSDCLNPPKKKKKKKKKKEKTLRKVKKERE